MNRTLLTVPTVLALVCLGCVERAGSNSGDSATDSAATSGAVPQLHTLVSNQLLQVAPGDGDGLLLTLPSSGTLGYTVVDQSTTTPGVWDLGFVTRAEYQNFIAGRSWKGYAVSSAVNNKTATTSMLSADHYLFVFRCRNGLDPCLFTYTLEATY
jgi:hypothetical protein